MYIDCAYEVPSYLRLKPKIYQLTAPNSGNGDNRIGSRNSRTDQYDVRSHLEVVHYDNSAYLTPVQYKHD